MKAKPYKLVDGKLVYCDPHEATDVYIEIPGPIPLRRLKVILEGKREGTPCWSWNGDTEKPTFKPSILSRGTRPITEEEYARIMAGEKVEAEKVVCHSFVNDGKVRFLDDCTHEFRGQTMDLLDVDF